MLRFVLPCMVLSCAAPSASSHSEPSRPFDGNCMDDAGRDHCDRGQRAKIERSFQVPRAEVLAEDGWEGLRVFMVDGYSNDMPLITVLHRAGAPPRLEVRGVSPRARTLEAPVEPELEAAEHKLRALSVASPAFPAASGPDVSSAGSGELEICLHAWVVYIEALEHGQVTRRIRNACQEEPLFKLAFALSSSGLARFPQCGLLRSEDYRNDSERLEACLELKGEDLQAAAEVHNRFMSLRAEDVEALRAALAADAILTRPEAPPLTGAEAISAWLAAKTADQGVVYLVSRGVVARADTADHEGSLEAFRNGVGTRAAFTQHWVKGADGVWRITRWALKREVSSRG